MNIKINLIRKTFFLIVVFILFYFQFIGKISIFQNNFVKADNVGITYYVSNTGSDSNSGISESFAFKTIQKAIDVIPDNAAGYQVLVLPGTYLNSDDYAYATGGLIENKHGEAGKEMIVRAYDINNKPVIISKSSGFRLVNSSYVIIEGFEIENYINAGISVNISDNIILRNNFIHVGFEGLCTATDGLPKCEADGSGVGRPKGRKDKNGDYFRVYEYGQNIGVYVCKSQNNIIELNRIENTDEGIYIGSAGEIVAKNCDSSAYPARLWTSGNRIDNNIINNSFNEGIEIKPDAIRSIVSNNLLKNSAGDEIAAIEVRSAYNRVFGNVIYGDNIFSKVGIRMIGESACSNPVNDEQGNSMKLYPKLNDSGYKCSFSNNVEGNYIYYSQGGNWMPAISSHETSENNVINHNTIVGGNDFGIIGDSPKTLITNNLILGDRSEKKAILTQFLGVLIESDFNAFYPSFTPLGSCMVSIRGENVLCQNDIEASYESNSIFMKTLPSGSYSSIDSPLNISSECSFLNLSDVSLDSLASRIIDCSKPLSNNFGVEIVDSAKDGTNIGAWQEVAPVFSPTPAPTLTGISVPVCIEAKVYKDGVLVTDFNNILSGDVIQLAVSSSNANKARFRVNGGSWVETMVTNSVGEYYIDYAVSVSEGIFFVDVQVSQ
jgi:parallel beta-helix repeat protein